MRPIYPVEFLAAVARVLKDEGRFVDNPADPGGATKFGISQRSYPNLDIRNLTRDGAIEIYFRDWWTHFRFGDLPSGIAAKVFDLAVNMGAAHATICLQRALRACGRAIEDDGILGEETIRSAAATVNFSREPVETSALMAALRSEAAGYYRTLAAHDERSDEFLRGWLNRAYE